MVEKQLDYEPRSREIAHEPEGAEQTANPDGFARRPAAATIDRLSSTRLLFGCATVHRVGRWSFPVAELTQSGETLARLGRVGSLRVFIGSGQRIELADGERWTLRSVGGGGAVNPVIVDSDHRKIAMAGLAHGTYGINCRDYAYVLYPTLKPRIGRANQWILRRHEDELAIVSRTPLRVEATLPVHLGAALLSLFLVRYRLPEESAAHVPAFRWGQR